MPMGCRSATVGVPLLAALVLFAGCSGGGEAKSAAREQSHIKTLAVLYGTYVGSHRGQLPPNEAAFKQYVQASSAQSRGGVTVADPQSIFVSERDAQPYVILYGDAARRGPSGGPAGSPVVIYEQVGVDGLRFVASNMGAVEEVDQARFKQLVSQQR
jgi:hypothetical protein